MNAGRLHKIAARRGSCDGFAFAWVRVCGDFFAGCSRSFAVQTQKTPIEYASSQRIYCLSSY
jgi:hypothetical protein